MSSQLNQDLDRFEVQEPTLFDRIFRDSQGNIVIIQPPNLPVMVGVGATLLQFALPPSHAETLLGLIGFGALFTWAWLEIFDGVNYFRRGLGLLVLTGMLTLGFSLGSV